MKEAAIYLTKYNKAENRYLVIEGDEHSVWAYVLDSSKHIEFEGFICSRGTILESPEEIGRFIKNNIQPPLLKMFANKNSIQEGLENNSFNIIWENKRIQIFLKETEFLTIDTKNKKAYSKSIAKEGSYGIPMKYS